MDAKVLLKSQLELRVPVEHNHWVPSLNYCVHLYEENADIDHIDVDNLENIKKYDEKKVILTIFKNQNYQMMGLCFRCVWPSQSWTLRKTSFYKINNVWFYDVEQKEEIILTRILNLTYGKLIEERNMEWDVYKT